MWCTTGDDPELDTFLLEFHPKVAAHREGGLSLRLGALDEQVCDLASDYVFCSKGGTKVSRKCYETIYDRIDRHATLSRGACSRGEPDPPHHPRRDLHGGGGAGRCQVRRP